MDKKIEKLAVVFAIFGITYAVVITSGDWFPTQVFHKIIEEKKNME